MTSSLIIEEKYSRYWPLIAAVSGIAAILSFTYYLMVDEVLLEGYMRLISFAFFSLTVLSIFKVKDGKVQISMSVEDGDLELEYHVRERLVYREEFSLDEIARVKVDRMPNRSLYNDIARKDRCVRFKKPKSGGWLYLNEIYGRVIPLRQDHAKQIEQYLLNFIEDPVDTPRSEA